MAEVRDQTLSGDQQVDNHVYINCEFLNARLIYEGGVPPGFNNCSFDNANFVFQGPAGYTLSFLRAMSPKETNMRGIVQGLLPELGD